jgi:uracil-DNA glycosylase family 4
MVDTDTPAPAEPVAAGPQRWSTRHRAMLGELGLADWVRAPGPRPAATPPPVSPAVAGLSRAPVETPREVREIPAAPIIPATAVAGASVDRPPPSPDAGPAARIATLDWDTLAATVAHCRDCRLCEGRTRTVFGTGSRQAQWLVVGEAPGEQEDLQGEPFVGKSGQLLDAMLRALGLSREDGTPPERAVYIANTVKCRPPGNRNPQPDELVACEPYLMRQIDLLKPRMILAMGRFAVQSLLRTDEPLGRLRGRVHRYQGVPLVVTWHPAYLLRSPREKARAWDDLCRARAAMRGDAS